MFQSSVEHDAFQQQQGSMAGVGARRLMQKQQMQIQRQRTAELEQEQRDREWRWREEERRRQVMLEDQRRHQQSVVAADEEHRLMRQQQHDGSERVRQANLSRNNSPRPLQTSLPDKLPTPRLPPSRIQTDSQATAKQEYHSSSDYDENQSSMPDGFGGWTNVSSVDSDAHVKLAPLPPLSSMASSSHGRAPSRAVSPMPQDAIAFTSSPRPAVRETVYEPLPKATCADCGEKLPFDDLVDHVCVRDACRSPLLTRGPDSLTSLVSAASKSGSTTPSVEPMGRSPFFDRYEQVRNDLQDGGGGGGGANRSNSFLRPDMTPSIRSTPSPYIRQGDSTPVLGTSISAHSSPMIRSSPLLGLGTDPFGMSDRDAERSHAHRKRQIEEQRAAARSAAMNRAPTPSSSSSRHMGLGLMTNTTSSSTLSVSSDNRTHRRGDAAGSISSASTASTKSSASSFFNHSNSGTITPSSSNEQVSDDPSPVSLRVAEKPVKYRPQGSSPSKRILDLQDIEGLVREIENSPPSPHVHLPPASMTRSPAIHQEGERHAFRRQQAGRDDRETTVVDHRRRRPSNDVRPTMTRARTRDGVDNKVCSVCLKSFQKGQPMVQRDGKILCVDDYAELYLEKCRKCNEAVRTVGVRSRDGALPGLFHRACFSCLQCHATFDDGTFYVFDGAPYCRTHYHRLNGTQCGACHEGIEGQCRQLDETGERFHLHCLTCQFDDGREFCKDLLNDYYVHAGKRLCQWHFDKCMDARRADGQRRERQQQQQQRQQEDWNDASAAVRQAEVRAARRTTYIRTVAAKKARA